MKRHAKPTQFLLRLFLVAAIIFLSSASMFSRFLAATSLFGPFTCDALSDATVGYDTSDKSAVGYDAGSVLTTGNNHDRTTRGRVSRGQFAGYNSSAR